MTSLLQEQKDLYGESWAGEFRDEAHEKLIAERRRLCRVLQLGLFIYKQISQIDEEWSEDSLSAEECGTAAERPAEIAGLYEWWLRPCPRLLNKVASLEAKSYSLPSIADEFRVACARARTKTAWDA